MTEKKPRFSIEQTTINDCIVDNATGEQLDTCDYAKRLCEVLNTLAEENEQLFNFKENVFNSIDGKIKRGEQAIEWGESVGADVGAMGFHIELLKQLKKELFE